MKFNAIFRTSPMWAIAAVLLSGCSGEPSNSDVKTLVERELKPMLEMQAAMMKGASALSGRAVPSSPPEVKDVKKVGCKQDGESAYRCDIEITVASGAEKKSQISPMRFVKGSSGWQLTK